jgi:hypothetical protein
MNVGNESGSTEQMDSLWDVFWLGDTLDELGNESLDILVDDKTTDLLHCTVGHLLDLWLGIPHRLGDDWDKIWYTEGQLCGSGSDKGLDTAETSDLFLPLLCGEDGVDDGWQDDLDGVCVDGLDDAQSSLLCGILDWDHLVTNGCQDGWEESDKIWLNSRRGLAMLSDSLDGVESALSYNGILLVRQLLLEGLDSPARKMSA